MSEDSTSLSELEQAAAAARAFQDGENDGPQQKKLKASEVDEIKSILSNIDKAVSLRLDTIESRLTALSKSCLSLEEKVNSFKSHLLQDHLGCLRKSRIAKTSKKPTAVFLEVPQYGSEDGISGSDIELQDATLATNAETQRRGDAVSNYLRKLSVLGKGVTLITLNTEEDFPDGSWLGDETNVEMRVRCHITNKELLHINTQCRSPEKMALALLDALFDKETQAMSNISGAGKLGKRQLPPLMIYGIRCHLIHHFNITESDWYRIKQNIDSKCRSAYRRKVQGLPLYQHYSREQEAYQAIPLVYNQVEQSSHSEESNSVPETSDLQAEHIAEDATIVTVPSGDEVQYLSSEIQVLHATPQQIIEMQQQGQQIQFVDVEGNTLNLPQGAMFTATDLDRPEGTLSEEQITFEESSVRIPGVDALSDERSIILEDTVSLQDGEISIGEGKAILVTHE